MATLQPAKNNISRTPLTVRFFKMGNKDMIRIDLAGDYSAPEMKVTPAHIEQFPLEWTAYQAGLDMPKVEGTPLTEIPGFSGELAQFYAMKGIHVCEQLEDASDIICQSLGMGARDYRKSAQNLLNAKKYEEMEAMRMNHREILKEPEVPQPEKRGPGRPPKPKDPEVH